MKQHCIYMTFILAIMTMGSACQTGTGGSSQLTQTAWSASCGSSTVPITQNTSRIFINSNCGCPFSITLSSTNPTCQFTGSNASACSEKLNCSSLYNDIINSNSDNTSGGGNGVSVSLENTTCTLTCPGYAGI